MLTAHDMDSIAIEAELEFDELFGEEGEFWTEYYGSRLAEMNNGNIESEIQPRP